MLRAMRVDRPAPHGAGSVDHQALAGVLEVLQSGGVPALTSQQAVLAAYRTQLESIDPDALPRDESLAYWLNLYNAGALDLAARAAVQMEASVLRVPGAFRSSWATVVGEELSLDDIEHGKIRRFKDPRIHGALVCGSASCPTLRFEPFRGPDIDSQLDDQMTNFLAGGGAFYDPDSNRLRLSRVFMWYGPDFVRPHRMPTWAPARRSTIGATVARWLHPDERDAAATADVEFLSYDWGLACNIA